MRARVQKPVAPNATMQPAAPRPRVTVTDGNDHAEREADRAAEEALARKRTAPKSCACGGPPGGCDCRASPPPSGGDGGSGGGNQLPGDVRTRFESHFGFDFASVRIHTDASAARAATQLHADALTRGADIAFAPGRFAPGTPRGDRLLAHELAHVVQQAGGAAAEGLSPVGDVVQRACAAAPCPALTLPLDALYPTWREAELCVQNTYRSTHPSNTISFNKDWVTMSSTRPREGLALKCVQAKGFTGKSGMFAGEPDIWDFSSQTMYEITTASGAAFRIGKLAAEVKLANDLTGTADCGGMMWAPGDWVPPGDCYYMGGDVYIKVVNNAGVLTYAVLKDATKEAALAALLALLAAGAKSGMFQGMGKALVGKIGGKALPGYAIASLVATIILVGSGKAEAKPGPGGGEPLLELFKSMAQKGEPVPPEVQEMIENDPELKKLVEDSINKTGDDPTDVQKRLNEKMLKLLADNKDQFSPEDLKKLLALSQSAGKALPESQLTVDTLKKLIAAKGAGSGTGTGTGTGTTTTPPPTTTTTAPPPTTTTAPPTTTGTSTTGTGTGTGTGLSAASRKQITDAPTNVRKLWDTFFTSTPSATAPKGPTATDADVDRFFSLVPPTLTSDQLAKILKSVEPYKGGSVSDVLDGLQAAVAGTFAPKGKLDPTGSGNIATLAPADAAEAEAGSTLAPDVRAAKLAAAAAAGDYTGMKDGNLRFYTKRYKRADLIAGARVSVTAIMLVGTTHCALGVTFRVDSVSGNDAKVTYVSSTEVVSANGAVAGPAGALIGNKTTFTITD